MVRSNENGLLRRENRSGERAQENRSELRQGTTG